MVPLFMQLSYIAYMKNDAYRYNLKYREMLQHKYEDSSDSDSDFDDQAVLSNFYTNAM